MKKRKKHKPMPKWVWYLPPKYLNYKLKHLLAFIWWYGDTGCREWNYKIAKRFKVSSRTIRRWIKKLDDEHFIYINFPRKRSRTLYRRPYFNMIIWLRKSGRVTDPSPNRNTWENPYKQRTEVSYISNAQRLNTNTTSIKTRQSIRKAAEKHGSQLSNLSSAEGLSCSKVLREDFPTAEEYWTAKLEELFDRVGVQRKHPAELAASKRPSLNPEQPPESEKSAK